MAAPAAAKALLPASTAVTVKITTHPATAARSTTAKFAWKTTGTGLTVTCRLGTGAYAKCSKSHSYANLTQGAHSFAVRVKHGSTTRSATYKWSVDTVAPTAPSVSGGSAAWTNSAVPISATGSTDTGGSGIASYQYRTLLEPGSTWSSAATGSVAAISATGKTDVQFRAVDKAGNVSAWVPATPDPTATAWVDKLAPSVPTVSGGSQVWQKLASVLVTASGSTDADSGGVVYEYRVQTPTVTFANAAITSGNSVAVTGEGKNQVQFRSADAVGNFSAWSAAADVWLDRIAPAVTVSGGSASWTNTPPSQVSATATDAGSGVDGATWAYRTSPTGTGSWTNGTGSSFSVPQVDGKLYIEFQVKDPLGNTSAWPASPTAGGTVLIDTAAPSHPTSVTNGSTTWKTGSTTFAASGSTDPLSGLPAGPYQFRTSPDGTNWSNWSATGAAAAVSGDGTTYVQMRAVDNAGNVSTPWPLTNGAANTANIDNTKPTVTTTGGSTVWHKAASVVITPSSSDPLNGANASSGAKTSTYKYQTSTNGGPWSAPTTASTATISAEGDTLVEFQVADNAGNVSDWSAPAEVRIDRTAPTVSAAGGSSAWQKLNSVVVTPAATDLGSGIKTSTYQYRTSFNSGAWSAATPGSSVTVSAEGYTQVEFQVTDNADNSGNTSAWSLPVDVRLDRTAPSVPTPSGGSSSWTNITPVVIDATGTSTDALSGMAAVPYQYRTSTDNGGTWSAATDGSTMPVSAQATTLVQFRAGDVAGNWSGWSTIQAAATAKIDLADPSMPSVSGGSSSWTTAASVTITASGSTDTGGSGVDYYEYETSRPAHGGGWPGPPIQGPAVITSQGLTIVRFRAVDHAGNVSAWGPTNTTSASEANIDSIPPPVPTVTPTAGCPAGTNTVTGFSANGTDGSPIDYYVKINNGPSTKINVLGTYDVKVNGTKISYQAVDQAGSPSGWSPQATICVS